MENSTIETTIAELLPKLPAGAATQAHTDYYADLKLRLTAMASRLRRENSLRVAVVLPTPDLFMLDDSDAFNSWWGRLYEKSKTELVTYVRRQLGVRLPKRPDLRELDPEVFKNSDAFIQQLWWLTWTRAKGPMWEWSVLLAMLIGTQLTGGGSEITVRVGEKEHPLPVRLNGHGAYLWYQRRVKAHRSSLAAKPEFLITRDSQNPTRENIVGFIECKCGKQVSSSTVREINGTRYDLAATFALLASYEALSSAIRDGAKNLGVSVLVNPLRDLKQPGYLGDEMGFFEQIKEEIEKVDRERPSLTYEEERWREFEKKRRW
jgi:hypothetical protein